MNAILAVRPDGATGRPPALAAGGGVPAAYLEDLIAGQPSASLTAISRPAAGDLAAFVHTGGTTGAPKIAAQTHASQLACARGITESSGLAPGEAMLGGLPLFHVNALIVTGIAPMFGGARVVWPGPGGYRDPALYQHFWKIVEHYRIAAMSAVPTVYGTLARLPVDADISSLRLPIVGASPLPSAVREGFARRTGVRLLEGYGLTEATCASTWTRPGEERTGSVGRALPGQQVKAVRIGEDGSRADCAPGETGVLAIGGPAVFAGYVTEPGPGGPRVSRGDAVRDGWLDTGDLGHLDADGFVYLTGRAKDLIIRGGHNIDPRVIEEALLRHPAVAAAAAVGSPDPHSGEVPVAYVVPADPGQFDEAELLAWAGTAIGERRRPAETDLPHPGHPPHRGRQALQACPGRRRRRARRHRGPGQRRPDGWLEVGAGSRGRPAGRHRDRRRPRPGARRPGRIRPHRPHPAVTGREPRISREKVSTAMKDQHPGATGTRPQPSPSSSSAPGRSASPRPCCSPTPGSPSPSSNGRPNRTRCRARCTSTTRWPGPCTGSASARISWPGPGRAAGCASSTPGTRSWPNSAGRTPGCTASPRPTCSTSPTWRNSCWPGLRSNR